jgi:hypothetical protein
MDSAYAVTVLVCVQVGIDAWQNKRHTRIFLIDTPLRDVLEWAGNYIKEPTVNDLIFSKVDG